MKSTHLDFLKVLSNYQGIIHKVNLIYFRTVADKEDNFQEIVYQLCKSYSSLKNKNTIGSWIYAIAINTSISKIRKDSKYIFTDSVPDTEQWDELENIEFDFDFTSLVEALHHLNEIDRSIILLYMEDFTYSQISETIGISSVNVGVRINRAKKQLKNILNKQAI